MSIMQMKRGTTDDWGRGPELIDFSNLIVNGKDSTLYCKGTHLVMNIGTSSAEDFSRYLGGTPNVKQLGLQIIHEGEFILHGDYRLRASVTPRANASTPYSVGIYGVSSTGTSTHLCSLQSLNPALGSEFDENTGDFGNFSSLVAIVTWKEEIDEPIPIDIHISLKRENQGEDSGELCPGQIGIEYTEEGSPLLKVGEQSGTRRWKDLPYVGQVIPLTMCVDNRDQLPTTAAPGTIMYVRRA